METNNSIEFNPGRDSSEQLEMNQKEKIWEFLGVKKPEHLELSNDMIEDERTKIEFWDTEKVEQRTAMKKPFWRIDAAVVLSNPERAGEKAIITKSEVTLEDCEGHYPEGDVVPLIEIVKRIAQSGILVVDYDKEPAIDPEKGPKYTPEVVSEKGTESHIVEYIKSPAVIIIEGKIFAKDEKGREYEVDFKAYDAKTGKKVATTRGMRYEAVPNRLRKRALQSETSDESIAE